MVQLNKPHSGFGEKKAAIEIAAFWHQFGVFLLISFNRDAQQIWNDLR